MLESTIKNKKNQINGLKVCAVVSRLLLFALLLMPVAVVEVLAQVNRAPWLEPVSRHELKPGQIFDLVITPFDPDGTPPSLSIVTAPDGVRLEDVGGGSGRLIWQPTAEQTGETVIVLVAKDAVNPDLQASRRLEISVSGGSSQQALVAEQSSTSNSNRVGFADPQSFSNQQVVAGSTFSMSVKGVSDNGVPALILREAPAGSRFTDNRDGTRTFSWTPSQDRVGTHTVAFVVRHPDVASLESEQRFQLEVLASSAVQPASTQANLPRQIASFNDHRPVIQPLSDVVMAPGGAVIFRVTPVDPDGTFATLVVDPLPAGASFEDNGDGTRTFFWQTSENDRGEHRITFTAIDGLDPGLSHSESLLITVGTAAIDLAASGNGNSNNNGQQNASTAPLFFESLSDQQVAVGQTVTQRVLARAAAGRPVPGLLMTRGPQNSVFTDNGDGSRTFSWTPGGNDGGEHLVEFQAFDGFDRSITVNASLRISVTGAATNQQSVASAEIRSSNTDVISLLAVGEQIGRPNQNLAFNIRPVHDGRPVPSLVLNNAPRGAALYDNGDGSRLFAWTPNNEQVGVFNPEVLAIDALDSSLVAVLPLRLVITNDVAGTTAIADPGASPLEPQNRGDASLFLTRATFGPRDTDIDGLMGKTYEQWINDQLGTPMTSHRDRLDAFLRDRGLFNISTGDRQLERSQLRSDAFWDVVVTAQDQLRQRVAFALSQILVISDSDQALENRVRGFAHYHDLLLRHAFGSYRDLLTDISLNPMMGDYLSSRRNEKADPGQNIEPDENFARELMQLFTIGLDQLDLNGNRRRDSQGNRLLSYTQEDVMNFARVFTGWNYGDAAQMRDDRRTLDSEILPMKAFEEFHDRNPKNLLNGAVSNGGGSARDDLNQALDNLFQHPNMPPFIVRQLIQHLVTSNPTPAYIERVARVFINDGGGTRGNLAAVVKAILLDPEALNGHELDPGQFGKLKEPVLKITALWRAFHARGRFNRFRYSDPFRDFAQQPYSSPSVFNFYSPNYRPPGDVGDLGLYAPEAQIITENTAIRGNNRLFDFVFEIPLGNDEIFANQHQINLDIGRQRALASDPQALVDNLNELLLAGLMSEHMRAVVTNLVESTPLDDNGSTRVREAIYLIVTSPEFAIQR